MKRMACLGLCLLLASTAAAQSRLNLPNKNKTAALTADAAAVVRYFSSPAAVPGRPLPKEIGQSLLASMPREYHTACADLVGNWGEEAKGTGRLRLRLLHREADAAWFALRCDSSSAELEKFYDERLMMLRGSTLQLLPLGLDADNDSVLYHVAFAEKLPLEGADAAVFQVTIDSENPCCGGGDNTAEDRLLFYVLRPEGARQVFSALVHRYIYSHDDVDGGAEITRKTDLSYERNPSGRIIAAMIRFQEETREERQKDKPKIRSGQARYRWNAPALRFDLQPVARPE